MREGRAGSLEKSPVHEGAGKLQKVKVAIVGTGRMGKTLSLVFKSAGTAVTLCSRFPEKAKEVSKKLGVGWGGVEKIADHDIVVLAVPTEHLPGVVRVVSGLMRPCSLLSDISSVKLPVVRRLLAEIPEHIEYISIHPLFGPTECFKGENVVVIPVRSKNWLNPFLQLLRCAGLNVAVATPEEHDRAMALVQVAHHFALLTLREVFKDLSGWAPSLGIFTTRSLRKTLKVMKRIEELIDVVEMIQRLNPYAKEAREAFIKAAKRVHTKFTTESKI